MYIILDVYTMYEQTMLPRRWGVGWWGYWDKRSVVHYKGQNVLEGFRVVKVDVVCFPKENG